MGIIEWLKPSVEGKDGKSSARALTNFWYVFVNTLVVTFMCYEANVIIVQEKVNTEAINTLWVIFWVFVTYNIAVFMIFGIVTTQNLIEVTKIVRGKDTPPVIVDTHTTTQITQTPATEEVVEENKE